jgi:hypothetical protein
MDKIEAEQFLIELGYCIKHQRLMTGRFQTVCDDCVLETELATELERLNKLNEAKKALGWKIATWNGTGRT